MSIEIEDCGQCHDQRSTGIVYNLIGVSLLVLDVQVELLKVCGPLLMEVVPQLASSLHKLQMLMVGVDDCFLSQNIMLPLLTSLDN